MRQLIMLAFCCFTLLNAAEPDTKGYKLKYTLVGGGIGLLSGGTAGTAVGIAVASGDWWPMDVLAGAIVGSGSGLIIGLTTGFIKGSRKNKTLSFIQRHINLSMGYRRSFNTVMPRFICRF